MGLKRAIIELFNKSFSRWEYVNDELSNAIIEEFIKRLDIRQDQLFAWETSTGYKQVLEYTDNWEYVIGSKLAEYPPAIYVIITGEEYSDKWFVIAGPTEELVMLLKELEYFEYAVIGDQSLEKVLFDTHTNKIIELVVA